MSDGNADKNDNASKKTNLSLAFASKDKAGTNAPNDKSGPQSSVVAELITKFELAKDPSSSSSGSSGAEGLLTRRRSMKKLVLDQEVNDLIQKMAAGVKGIPMSPTSLASRRLPDLLVIPADLIPQSPSPPSSSNSITEPTMQSTAQLAVSRKRELHNLGEFFCVPVPEVRKTWFLFSSASREKPEIFLKKYQEQFNLSLGQLYYDVMTMVIEEIDGNGPFAHVIKEKEFIAGYKKFTWDGKYLLHYLVDLGYLQFINFVYTWLNGLNLSLLDHNSQTVLCLAVTKAAAHAHANQAAKVQVYLEIVDWLATKISSQRNASKEFGDELYFLMSSPWIQTRPIVETFFQAISKQKLELEAVLVTFSHYFCSDLHLIQNDETGARIWEKRKVFFGKIRDAYLHLHNDLYAFFELLYKTLVGLWKLPGLENREQVADKTLDLFQTAGFPPSLILVHYAIHYGPKEGGRLDKLVDYFVNSLDYGPDDEQNKEQNDQQMKDVTADIPLSPEEQGLVVLVFNKIKKAGDLSASLAEIKRQLLGYKDKDGKTMVTDEQLSVLDFLTE